MYSRVFSTGKFKTVTGMIMGLNPPNPGRASNTVVYIVMEALGFHIVFVESYNHLSPNVEIYMCQIRMTLYLVSV